MHVLIIAGGTGGHIFPGLAVADALRADGHAITWLGSEKGMERSLVAQQFHVHTIPVYQLRGKGLKACLLFPTRLCVAVFKAIRLFHTVRPDVVISFGGFVAGPGSIAAKLLRKPLIIHEQNARAGLTNRWLSKCATITLQAFPQAFNQKKKQYPVVGNPIRCNIQALPLPAERLRDRQGPLHLLILGGSLGATAINTVIINWLTEFLRADELMVRHQTGKADHDRVTAAYASHCPFVEVLPFIDDMATSWAWADVVICRAGAITVSEVAAVGVAAIFVPLPTAVDNHQFYNAKYLVDEKAARMIEQHQLSLQTVSDIISAFLDDRRAVLTMSEAARRLAKPNATQDIVSAIKDCI